MDVDQLAEIVWDYHHLHHELKQSAAILVLCSNDVRVAKHAADLYLAGWAPLLIFSGGVGALTRGLFGCSEAEHFAKIAIECGVPESKILVEPHSTNTGENILFTQQLLHEKQLDLKNFIVVQKPFMERRSYATFKKHWPDRDLIVSTQDISFKDYPNEILPKDDVINVMVGDLQRIKEYPAKGFQIEQDIPDSVWQAFEQLVVMGFDKHLI